MFAITPVLTIVLFAFPQPAEEPAPFSTISRVSGKFYVAEYTAEMVRKTPRWDEDAEYPPVSPRKAMRLATKMKDSVFKNHDAFIVNSLALMPVSGGWVWTVTFWTQPKVAKDGRPQLPEMINLVVLMDGTVPKPVESAKDFSYGSGFPAAEKDTQGETKKSPTPK